jgi:hypothetical protein
MNEPGHLNITDTIEKYVESDLQDAAVLAREMAAANPDLGWESAMVSAIYMQGLKRGAIEASVILGHPMTFNIR